MSDLSWSVPLCLVMCMYVIVCPLCHHDPCMPMLGSVCPCMYPYVTCVLPCTGMPYYLPLHPPIHHYAHVCTGMSDLPTYLHVCAVVVGLSPYAPYAPLLVHMYHLPPHCHRCGWIAPVHAARAHPMRVCPSVGGMSVLLYFAQVRPISATPSVTYHNPRCGLHVRCVHIAPVCGDSVGLCHRLVHTRTR